MFFVAKICKRALRASIEGYLAVAASTPTYSSLALIMSSMRCWPVDIILGHKSVFWFVQMSFTIYLNWFFVLAIQFVNWRSICIFYVKVFKLSRMSIQLHCEVNFYVAICTKTSLFGDLVPKWICEVTFRRKDMSHVTWQFSIGFIWPCYSQRKQ